MAPRVRHFRSAMVVILVAAATRAGSAYADAPDPEGPSDSLEEVVVTANKRSQNLQDVAMTASVLGRSELEEDRITSLQDVADAVPGLTYSPTETNTPVFTLRGIGFDSGALSAYPAVSVYLDEVPLAGIGLVESSYCDQVIARGELVRLLPRWTSLEIPVFAVYPSRKFLPPRVSVFLNALANWDCPLWIRG
jgi:DNA-binding transcriptional LysR family regulator